MAILAIINLQRRAMLRTLLITLILTTTIGVNGQVSVGGEPYSLKNGMQKEDVETIVIPKPNMHLIELEDEQRSLAGLLELNGRMIEVDRDLSNSGTWTDLPNGDRIWRLIIEADDALATELFYKDFYIPSGASLHLYDMNDEQLIGGFTSYNNHESGLFTTDLIKGSTCVVEYFEPANVRGEGTLNITHVGYSYRHVPGMSEAKAQDCEVDINCDPEGNDWTDQRGSVVRIRVLTSQGVGWCSGSVMNNTDQDCTPYVLTAFHCGEDASTANYLQWKIYFNYQRPGCEIGNAISNQSMTACIKKADSNDGGGASGSDFLLIEMEDEIPIWYGAFYSGWDATGNGSNIGVSIHHPDGDEKKISTYTSNLVSATWPGGSANGAHWRVIWTGTQNGHGVTEGGSSGSPIYNSDKRLIGTLTGGASYCNSVVPGGQNQPDYYGKMDWHWDGNSNPTADLKDFLDPGNTGSDVYDGQFNPCNFVGIEETSLDELSIYPNPSIGVFNISFDQRNDLFSRYEVYNAVGSLIMSKEIYSAGDLEIDLSDLESGSYFVTIWNNIGDELTKTVMLLK